MLYADAHRVKALCARLCAVFWRVVNYPHQDWHRHKLAVLCDRPPGGLCVPAYLIPADMECRTKGTAAGFKLQTSSYKVCAGLQQLHP